MVYLSVSENVLFVDLPEPTVKRDTFIEMLNDKDSLKLDRYPFSAYREQPQACPPPALRASNTLLARTHAHTHTHTHTHTSHAHTHAHTRHRTHCTHTRCGLSGG